MLWMNLAWFKQKTYRLWPQVSNLLKIFDENITSRKMWSNWILRHQRIIYHRKLHQPICPTGSHLLSYKILKTCFAGEQRTCKFHADATPKKYQTKNMQSKTLQAYWKISICLQWIQTFVIVKFKHETANDSHIGVKILSILMYNPKSWQFSSLIYKKSNRMWAQNISGDYTLNVGLTKGIKLNPRHKRKQGD